MSAGGNDHAFSACTAALGQGVRNLKRGVVSVVAPHAHDFSAGEFALDGCFGHRARATGHPDGSGGLRGDEALFVSRQLAGNGGAVALQQDGNGVAVRQRRDGQRILEVGGHGHDHFAVGVAAQSVNLFSAFDRGVPGVVAVHALGLHAQGVDVIFDLGKHGAGAAHDVDLLNTQFLQRDLGGIGKAGVRGQQDGRFERAGQTGCAHSVGEIIIASDDRVFAGAGTHIGHGLRGDKRSGFSGGIARKTRERRVRDRVVGGELGRGDQRCGAVCHAHLFAGEKQSRVGVVAYDVRIVGAESAYQVDANLVSPAHGAVGNEEVLIGRVFNRRRLLIFDDDIGVVGTFCIKQQVGGICRYAFGWVRRQGNDKGALAVARRNASRHVGE